MTIASVIKCPSQDVSAVPQLKSVPSYFILLLKLTVGIRAAIIPRVEVRPRVLAAVLSADELAVAFIVVVTVTVPKHAGLDARAAAIILSLASKTLRGLGG